MTAVDQTPVSHDQAWLEYSHLTPLSGKGPHEIGQTLAADSSGRRGTVRGAGGFAHNNLGYEGRKDSIISVHGAARSSQPRKDGRSSRRQRAKQRADERRWDRVFARFVDPDYYSARVPSVGSSFPAFAAQMEVLCTK